MTDLPKTGWNSPENPEFYDFGSDTPIPAESCEELARVVEVAAETETWRRWRNACREMPAAFLRMVYAVLGWPRYWVPKSLHLKGYGPVLEKAHAVVRTAASLDKLTPAEREVVVEAVADSRVKKAQVVLFEKPEPLELMYELTPVQQEAVDVLVASYSEAQRHVGMVIPPEKKPQNRSQWEAYDRELWRSAMVMAGSAGVGKSLVTFGAVLRLMEANPGLQNVLLTAYTHVAAKVVRHYFEEQLEWLDEQLPVVKEPFEGRGAWTFELHGVRRWISVPTTVMSGFSFVRGLVEVEGSDSRKGGGGKALPWNLAVIDEASMVPSPQMRALLLNLKFPLLLVGDPGQLPPIEDLKGERDYFTRMVDGGFKAQVAGFGNLMAAPNMRTDEGSRGILDLAYRLRNHVELPPEYTPPEPLSVPETLNRTVGYLSEAAGTPGVTSIAESAAVREFADGYRDPAQGPGTAAIIVGTHKRRAAFNRQVRGLLGFGAWGTLRAGETVVMEGAVTFTGEHTRISNNELLEVVEAGAEPVPVQVTYTESIDWTRSQNQREEDGDDTGISGLPVGSGVSFETTLPCLPAVVRTVSGDEESVMVPVATLETSAKQRSWRTYHEARIAYGKAVDKARFGVKHSKVHALLALWLGVPFEDNLFLRPRTFGFTVEDKVHYMLGNFGSFVPEYVLKQARMAAQGRKHEPEFSAEEVDAVREMMAFLQSNILLAHYGYAITGHASQGSQFGTVYLNADPPQMYEAFREGDTQDGKQAAQGVLKWAYVASTRAKRRLQIIDPPDLSRLLVQKQRRKRKGASKKEWTPVPVEVPKGSASELLSKGLAGLD